MSTCKVSHGRRTPECDVLVSDLAPRLQWAYCTVPGAGAASSSNGNNASLRPGANASPSDTHGTDPRCHLPDLLQWKVERAFIIHPTSHASSKEHDDVYWNRKGNGTTAVHCGPDLQCLFPCYQR